MKHYGRIISGTLLIAVFLTSCISEHAQTTDAETLTSQKAEQKEWSYDFHYGSDYWKYYDFSNSYISTQDNFEALVAAYIPQIEDLLGVEDWYTMYDTDAETVFVNLEMGGTPHSAMYSPSKGANKTIEFSILLSLNQSKMLADRALPHELTHSVLGTRCFSNSLEEGICDYTAARIGVNYSSFFEENDIDIMDYFTYNAKLALENLYDEKKSSEILDSIGRAGGYTYSIQTQDGAIWYECSQCFVEYLVSNYGIEKTMQLIMKGTGETDYQTYLGISYEELKSEWITCLRDYESMYTMEEYQEMTKAFFQVNRE